MKKISQKISLAIVLSVLIVSSIIGTLSIVESTSIIEKNAQKNLLETSGKVCEQMNTTLSIFQTKLEDLSITIADDVDMEQMKNNPSYAKEYSNKIVPLVTKYAVSGKINVDCYVNFLNEYSRDGYLIGPNVINLDGKGFKRVDFETKIKDMEADKKISEWYYKPIELKKGYWMAPYHDPITKFYMVSYSVPIFVNNNVVGIAGMDIKFDAFKNIVNSAKVYNTGHASLLDSNLDYLVDPVFKTSDNLKTVNNGELKGLADYVAKNNSGVYHTKVEGKDKLIAFSKLANGDTLLVSVDSSEVLQEERNLTIIISFITIIGVIIAAFAALFVSSHISTPIKKLKKSAEEIANGNLDTVISVDTKDEIGRFADTFSTMVKKLTSTYQELSSVYEELTATEEELRTQYEELQSGEEALKVSDERYRLAIEGANDAIWEWDLTTGEFFASDKLKEISGYNLNKIIRFKDFSGIIHPDDVKKVKKDLIDHINNKTEIYKSEFRVRIGDGSYIWLLSRAKALINSEGKAIKIAGSMSDITDSKDAEDKIKFMAFNDSLTKLPNRVSFMNKLQEEIDSANVRKREGAVFFIDLDNFKNINDTMGHDYGDKVLIYLSEKLKTLIDDEDTLSRLGGDEFMVIHPYDTPSEVEEYANKLLTIFSNIFEIDNKQIYITASIGVAVYPKDGSDSISMLKNSDFAMYKAKGSGKNRFALYDEAMYFQLERKTRIERVLRKAVESDELSIYYQPQYDTHKNVIFGFEALLRLNSKELGFISPAEFIPIAEESGYITKLDRWILNEACKQCVKWLDAGCNFKSISINVSSVDVQQADFLESIRAVIKNTKINPSIVELEITETALMKSLDFNISILKELMDMGIRIALDDFGTGYSSLNYLRKIPISTLKIDKSFIDNITSNIKEESIVNNTIQMAHSMDLKVVAEGVETIEQLSILKDRCCDYIQGYYFSKPLPADEIEKLLKSGDD